MVSGQRVLLVDGSSETEEVLKAVLEPRGLRIDHLAHPSSNQTASELGHPNVLVLREDSGSPDDSNRSEWGRVPRVIIGSARISPASDGPSRYLREPFQYRELIQAIEQLLATTTD